MSLRVGLNGMLLKRPYSGVEQSILRLARALDARGGHAYHMHVPSDFSDEELGRKGLRLVPARVPPRSRIARIAFEHLALRVTGAEADVFHAPGYILPRAEQVPAIVTVYDLMALDHPQWCRVSNRLYYGLALPDSIRRADGIIVPSESTRSALLKRFPEVDECVRVIPLGVGEEFTPQVDPTEQARVRDMWNLPTEFLLFVGQSEPKKNLGTLLAAFSVLRRSGRGPQTLVIAGKPGWHHRDLVEQARTLGITADVRFLGAVAARDLPVLYRMAKLFVFPSRYEGFGLPPLEAMACGTPVLCSSAGALQEYACPAAHALDHVDVGTLAKGLEYVLSDDHRLRSLATRGVEHTKRFTWRRCAAETERFYEWVVERAARATEAST